METLPIEMVGQISSHLNPQELAACCAVSILWRNIFNNDLLWQQRCRPDLGKYLKTAKCKVDPKFVSPVTKRSSLSPVGEWRISFMRENHLWNNWRNGKRVVKKLFRLKRGIGCLITDDIFLFVDFMTGALLWDVSFKRVSVVGEPFRLLQGFVNSSSKFYVTYERFGFSSIIIRQESVVMIYDISSPVNADWKLRHVFLCDGNKKIDISEAEEYAKNYVKKVKRNEGIKSIVIGNKFVAIVHGSSGPAIHIWDAENGIKLKEDSFPEGKKGEKICIQCGENSMPFFIVYDFDLNRTTFLDNYFLYSLDSLDFLPFTLKIHFCTLKWVHPVVPVFLVDKLFAIQNLNRNHLEIYNFTTSELLFKFSTDFVYPKMCDNKIYFISRKQVKMFNFATMTVENLPPFEANNGILTIEKIICDKFFFVEKMNGINEVWEAHKLLVNSKTLSKITLTNTERSTLAISHFSNVYNNVHESLSRVCSSDLDGMHHIVDFW